jgi:hypothetical protein
MQVQLRQDDTDDERRHTLSGGTRDAAREWVGLQSTASTDVSLNFPKLHVRFGIDAVSVAKPHGAYLLLLE